MTALSCHGRVGVDGELDRLAEPADLLAVAAAAGAQRLAAEADRRRRLDDLDGHGGDAGRDTSSAESPGLCGPGTDAAGVGEHRRDERAAVVVVAGDLHRPHRAGALGHRLLRLDLGERLEQRVGQEHADDVAGGARLRRDGVDDRPDGRLDLDRRQAAVVVGQLGVEHASAP